MATQKLRGNVVPVLGIRALQANGSPVASAAVSYAADCKRYALTYEDRDDSDLTFQEAADGLLQDAVLTLGIRWGFDADSFCSWAWDNAGKDVQVTFGPYGVAPSVTRPHFVGIASTGGRPGLENTARRSTDTTGAETEIVFTFSTPLEKVTAAA